MYKNKEKEPKRNKKRKKRQNASKMMIFNLKSILKLNI